MRPFFTYIVLVLALVIVPASQAASQSKADLKWYLDAYEETEFGYMDGLDRNRGYTRELLNQYFNEMVDFLDAVLNNVNQETDMRVLARTYALLEELGEQVQRLISRQRDPDLLVKLHVVAAQIELAKGMIKARWVELGGDLDDLASAVLKAGAEPSPFIEGLLNGK